jgi:hypothetical protein
VWRSKPNTLAGKQTTAHHPRQIAYLSAYVNEKVGRPPLLGIKAKDEAPDQAVTGIAQNAP